MRNISLHIATLFFFLTSLTLDMQGQSPVVLKVPSMDLDTNQSAVEIEVEVESFVNVNGVQFTLNWNPAVLQFQSIDDLGLEDMTVDNFGTNQVNEGILTFYWYDQTTQGVSVSDGHVIFSVQMNVLGDLHQFTEVSFGSDPTEIEVIDTENNVLNVELENGMITIGGLSSTNNTHDLKNLLSINPNPFKESANLSFSLTRRSQAHLSIFNSEGKIVFDNTMILGSGSHTIPIRKNDLPTAGNYFLTLKTDEFTTTRKLVFVQ